MTTKAAPFLEPFFITPKCDSRKKTAVVNGFFVCLFVCFLSLSRLMDLHFPRQFCSAVCHQMITCLGESTFGVLAGIIIATSTWERTGVDLSLRPCILISLCPLHDSQKSRCNAEWGRTSRYLSRCDQLGRGFVIVQSDQVLIRGSLAVHLQR